MRPNWINFGHTQAGAKLELLFNKRPLESYSQHFILFATYEWASNSQAIPACVMLHSYGLLSLFVSRGENEVLQIRPLLFDT